jgi:hypothetical protein
MSCSLREASTMHPHRFEQIWDTSALRPHRGRRSDWVSVSDITWITSARDIQGPKPAERVRYGRAVESGEGRQAEHAIGGPLPLP